MRENSAIPHTHTLDRLIRRIDQLHGRVAAAVEAMATDPELIWPALDLAAAGDHLHQAAVAIEKVTAQLGQGVAQ